MHKYNLFCLICVTGFSSPTFKSCVKVWWCFRGTLTRANTSPINLQSIYQGKGIFTWGLIAVTWFIFFFFTITKMWAILRVIPIMFTVQRISNICSRRGSLESFTLLSRSLYYILLLSPSFWQLVHASPLVTRRDVWKKPHLVKIRWTRYSWVTQNWAVWLTSDSRTS